MSLLVVAAAAAVRGQSRAGPVPEGDGHGATSHSRRIQREEGGDEYEKLVRAGYIQIGLRSMHNLLLSILHPGIALGGVCRL